MTTITFDRMGRNHNPPVVTTTSIDPNEIAEAVYRVARKHLMSSGIEVVVDLDQGTATIFAGFRVGGTGKVVFG